MRQERIVNNAQTLLSSGINNSQTTITVSDGSVFPSEGDFRIVIDDELMLVTARSGNSLTVVRASEGSTATTHAALANVKAVVSEQSFEQRLSDFQGLVHVGTTPPLRLQDGNILTSSDFTWVNQGTATVTDLDNGAIKLSFPNTASRSMRILVRSAPATPYSIIMAWYPAWFHNGSTGFPQAGMLFRNSSDGKIVNFAGIFCEQNTARHNTVQVRQMNSPTSYNTDFGIYTYPLSNIKWMKIEDDGANHNFYASPDGSIWSLFLSQNRTDWLSNGGDQVGFYGDTDFWNNAASGFLDMVVRHWSVE